MISKLWLFLILIGITYACFTHRMTSINEVVLNSPYETVELMLKFSALIVFWSGMLNVAKDGGFLQFVAKRMKKVTTVLFPEIPKDSKCHEYISGNITANVLGLGSAATPFGLKAFQEMQKLNKEKEVATKSMVSFLILNTSGLTLIPTTIIALRSAYGAKITTEIIPYIMLATTITTLVAILIIRILK